MTVHVLEDSPVIGSVLPTETILERSGDVKIIFRQKRRPVVSGNSTRNVGKIFSYRVGALVTKRGKLV